MFNYVQLLSERDIIDNIVKYPYSLLWVVNPSILELWNNIQYLLAKDGKL